LASTSEILSELKSKKIFSSFGALNLNTMYSCFSQSFGFSHTIFFAVHLLNSYSYITILGQCPPSVSLVWAGNVKLFGNLIKETAKKGAICCTTSVDGIIGEPYAVIYSTTKAGIISLTKSYARYFGEDIRVNAVAPGLIDTPLTASSGEDPAVTTDYSIIKRMGKPEEIANAINFLLSNEASFITGQILAVDGGFTLK